PLRRCASPGVRSRGRILDGPGARCAVPGPPRMSDLLPAPAGHGHPCAGARRPPGAPTPAAAARVSRRVTTWYLKMTAPGELRAPARGAELDVHRATPPSPALNRSLYAAVGGEWHWTDRLSWSDAD